MKGKTARGAALIGCLAMLTGGLLAPAAYAAASGDLLWARSAGGSNDDWSYGIAVDAAGNALVTGSFDTSATFGVGEANETTLTAVGLSDVFIAKFAPDGALLWARSAGGSDEDDGTGIATDDAGNALVIGAFSGSATFGAGEANETTLAAAGLGDIFIAQYAPDGTLLWARTAGGSDEDYGTGIAVDAAGNAVATGSFFGSATFGAGEANETTLTAAGFVDLFIAQYAPDGTLLWARAAGGGLSEVIGYDIAVDAGGNAVVTGYFAGSAIFGVGEANETTLTALGNPDIFIARYAPDGTLLWARSAGGSFSADSGYAIAVDAAGNGLVTGRFGGDATFGAGEANETTLNTAGSWDIFIAKYAAAPDKIGVFRPSTRRFYLDIDGSNRWTVGDITTAAFGTAGDLPIKRLGNPTACERVLARRGRASRPVASPSLPKRSAPEGGICHRTEV